MIQRKFKKSGCLSLNGEGRLTAAPLPPPRVWSLQLSGRPSLSGSLTDPHQRAAEAAAVGGAAPPGRSSPLRRPEGRRRPPPAARFHPTRPAEPRSRRRPRPAGRRPEAPLPSGPSRPAARPLPCARVAVVTAPAPSRHAPFRLAPLPPLPGTGASAAGREGPRRHRVSAGQRQSVTWPPSWGGAWRRRSLLPPLGPAGWDVSPPPRGPPVAAGAWRRAARLSSASQVRRAARGRGGNSLCHSPVCVRRPREGKGGRHAAGTKQLVFTAVV